VPVIQAAEKTDISQTVLDPFVVFVDQVEPADLLLLVGESK
jgi:hypothetical protein